MATTYQQKKHRQNSIIYTLVAILLICSAFFVMTALLYKNAENEAYEMLHLQTKQVKDDLTLQLNSDRENLVTMASFASELYSRGESYALMFDSFKPIGLFSRIGILTPDCKFITKDETVDISDKTSFEKMIAEGENITGRTYSYSRPDEEVVRVSVPIVVNKTTVGLMYGIIKIETINEKYGKMADELDAQLFVYDNKTGKFIIDTFNEKPGELSDLATREYNDGYSYAEILLNDKGYSSFKSIRTGENLYVHYSTIDDFDWGIMLARYESQVFAKTHALTHLLLITFLAMLLVIAIYLWFVMSTEKGRTKVIDKASSIRKLLLEINQKNSNLHEALKNIQEFSCARSSFFMDTSGEDYQYVLPNMKSDIITGEDKKYFVGELFKFAAEIHSANKTAIEVLRIVADKHLMETNEKLYCFFNEHNLNEVSYAIVTNENNHVSVLGVINPDKSQLARVLLEEIAVCFSIAIYNKKHLNKTELAATTDSLTGVLNRVSYKKDILRFDEERPDNFSCIYIDVNELHLCNNKYGHASGDEMLIYIANSLKEVFFGHYIYRMGGDEFLVFAKNTTPDGIKNQVETLVNQLKIRNYTVAIGTSFRACSSDCEEMVREAEIRMYESKAQYYQNKENRVVSADLEKKYVQIKTGIREIDTILSILKDHYNGIYRVSLENDNAHRILMPSYLGYNEDEENFSKLLTKYIDDSVNPDFHRAVMSFLNYDALRRQIADGIVPKTTFKKVDGETVILSVHSLDNGNELANETLWVFAKE